MTKVKIYYNVEDSDYSNNVHIFTIKDTFFNGFVVIDNPDLETLSPQDQMSEAFKIARAQKHLNTSVVEDIIYTAYGSEIEFNGEKFHFEDSLASRDNCNN